MTSLLSAVRRGSQTPRVANYPKYLLSAAPEVIDLAEHAGLVLDEWQRYVLTHGLGMSAGGLWTAPKVSVWVPRQNGKGGIIEALELAWLYLDEEPEIVHSAHEHRTSAKAYRRMERLIRQTPDLLAMVKQFRHTNGEQQIELHTSKCGGGRDCGCPGRLLQYNTRSGTATRGFSSPKIILDEAQELDIDQMAAILPTVSAMPNWQIWFLGTPPRRPDAWCYGLREDGEQAKPRLAHFDWGADLNLNDPADRERVNDPELWYATNPALGIRIELQTVEDENTPSGLGAKFPQERLGVWQPRAIGGSGVISADLWQDLADTEASRPADVAFALHVNLTRTHAAIAYAGRRDDGHFQVGMVDYRPGTGWVVDRVVQLREKWNPIAVGVDTRSESLLLELEKAGITAPEDPEEPGRGDLAMPTAPEAASAFGLFVDTTRGSGLRHLDEAPINVALAGAKVRSLAGGQAWDHRSEVEVSPLVAVTLALWAYVTRVDAVNDDYDPMENIW